MEYEDRLSITTPEGIVLELTLAGFGSRAMAGLVDLLIQIVLIGALDVALAFVLSREAGLDGEVVAGILSLLTLVLLSSYHVLFETRGAGRTPGKRLGGLRVVGTEGQPVRFLSSAVRNAVRLVDGLPVLYIPGMISILVTSRNQRLGDLAAGTVVIRERMGGRAKPAAAVVLPDLDEQAAVWDVSGVTAEETATVRHFLERREDLTPEARARLAGDLAQRLRPRVPGAPQDDPPETFLEQLAAAKAARG